MDQLDRARLVIAVEDTARTYYGGVFGFSGGDAVRYVSEGFCNRYPAHTLRDVWAVAEEYVSAHPAVLTYSEGHIADVQRLRGELSERMAQQAFEAMQAGRLDEAKATVDSAELFNPDHRVLGRHDWSTLREVITNKADA